MVSRSKINKPQDLLIEAMLESIKGNTDKITQQIFRKLAYTELKHKLGLCEPCMGQQ